MFAGAQCKNKQQPSLRDCPGCPCVNACGREGIALLDALADRYGDADAVTADLIAYPFGGMEPVKLIEVWQSKNAAPLACRCCQSIAEPAEWDPDARLCARCKEART